MSFPVIPGPGLPTGTAELGSCPYSGVEVRALPEVRWELFPGETPLPGGRETKSEVPVMVEAASPDVSDEESGSCAGVVLADPLITSELSVPVLPKGLLMVKLGTDCRYVADDPAAGRVAPGDATPVLEASCAVSNPGSEELLLLSDKSVPLKVTVAPICADTELPLLCGRLVYDDLSCCPLVGAPR